MEGSGMATEPSQSQQYGGTVTAVSTKRGRVAIAAVAFLAVAAVPASSSTTIFQGASEWRVQARGDSTPLRFIQALAFDPHDSNTIWAALEGESSLYRSDDGAQTWRRINALPQGQSVRLIGLDRSGQELYVAADEGRLWRSSDGGATWHRVAKWPRLIVAIAVDPSDAGTVYAVTGNVVSRTSDSGHTWRRASRGLPKGEPSHPWYGDLVLNPLHLDTLYLVTHRRGLYRSSNAGRRWAPTSRNCSRDCLAKTYPGYGDFAVLAIDPSRPRRLYVGQPFDIYRSTDWGDRWRRVLSIDRGFGGDLVVARDGTVYANGTIHATGALVVARSRDGAARWTRTLRFKGRPPGTAYLAPGPLAVDPKNPEVVLAAVGAGDDGGAPVCVRLLKTTNGGATWKPADSGLVPPGHGCRV
jgi:photosystem II stability/assembly factor-like uncharacterized protein